MKNNIIAFLSGALVAVLVFFKFKSPDVVNIAGDNIEEQKVKDNSKHKLSRKERRILKRKNKKLT